MKKKENIIQEKSFQFALSVIDLYKRMQRDGEYVLSRQLLKSGTSIGANVEESSAAQSRKDFISKLAIASKESKETRYWLMLIDKSQHYHYDISKLLSDIDEIICILCSIVKTASRNP